MEISEEIIHHETAVKISEYKESSNREEGFNSQSKIRLSDY